MTVSAISVAAHKEAVIWEALVDAVLAPLPLSQAVSRHSFNRHAFNRHAFNRKPVKGNRQSVSGNRQSVTSNRQLLSLKSQGPGSPGHLSGPLCRALGIRLMGGGTGAAQGGVQGPGRPLCGSLKMRIKGQGWCSPDSLMINSNGPLANRPRTKSFA